jgi:peptide/nickel transport system substrate-binding protein
MERPQGTRRGAVLRLAAAVGALLLLAACGGGGATTTGSGGTTPTAAGADTSTLTVQLISTGTNRIPALTTTGEDSQINGQIYDALLEIKPGTTEVGPGLATSWTVSPDGKTWTLQLRKGVKWQRGYGEFTCSDVQFTWAFNKDPNNHGFWQTTANLVDSIDCPDPYTAVFHLKSPYLGFVWNLANIQPSTGYVMSKAAWDKLGKDGYEQTPIGTGPYMLDSVVPNQQVVLVANPDYWGPQPSVKKIIFKEITDTNTAALAVKTGQLDIASIDAVTAEQYKNVPGTQLIVKKAMHTDYLEINETVKPFDDVRVREAMRYAIDYEGLVKSVVRGYGQPGYSGMIAPMQTGFDPNVNHPNVYDPVKAKALLQQAGVKLPIQGFFTTYNDTQDVNMAQYIAADFQAVGIDLQPRPLERGTLVQVRIQPTTPASIIGDTWGPDPSENFNGTLLGADIPPKGLDIARYTGIDQLFAAQQSTPNQADRLKYLSQIQDQITKDVPVIQLYLGDDIWLINSRVHNFEPTVLFSSDPFDLVTLSAK